jgi:hypothetical protein
MLMPQTPRQLLPYLALAVVWTAQSLLMGHPDAIAVFLLLTPLLILRARGCIDWWLRVPRGAQVSENEPRIASAASRVPSMACAGARMRTSTIAVLAFAAASAIATPAWCGQERMEPGRYRVYALESSVADVRSAGAIPASEVRTVHEQPSRIEELEWRAPYVTTAREATDPVRAIAFSFCDDVLYRIVVDYDRDGTDGMTDRDLVESFAAVYGAPRRGTVQTRAVGSPDQTVLAEWSSSSAVVMLLRGVYSPAVQLVLSSPAVSARARDAIAASIRQNVLDAPVRDAAQRQKEVMEATKAKEKLRATNKAGFRP